MSIGKKRLLGLGAAILLFAAGWGYWPLHREANPEAPIASVAADNGRLLVDNFDYRKTSQIDPGTIRVFLRNASPRPVALTKVRLDGLAIPVWGVDWVIDAERPSRPFKPDVSVSSRHGSNYESAAELLSHERIVWAKLTGTPVAPGAIVEFSAKLSAPMSRPMKLELVQDCGETIVLTIRPSSPNLCISNITFTDKLDKIYIYLEGQSDEPAELDHLELDGQPIGQGLGLSSAAVNKREKQLASITLSRPLKQGQYITLKAVCKDGSAAEERTRVFTGFPITVERGAAPRDFGLDEQAYTNSRACFDAPADKGPASQPISFKGRDYIFECPMHSYAGDKTRSSYEIFRRYASCAKMDPDTPCVIHVCRVRPDEAFALFAETADILEMNPNIMTLAPNSERGAPETASARLAHSAYLAARPRPLHALVDTTKFGSDKGPAEPDELRRRAFAGLAQGSKGIFYRHNGWGNPSSAINQTIRGMNAELKSIRALLAIADPVDWVKLEAQPQISTYGLLAGDQGVILIVIKHSTEGLADASSARITLDLPRWCVLKSVKLATPGGLRELNLALNRNLELPVPDCANIYVLEK